MPNASFQRMKLAALSYIAPPVAGKIATQLFSQSRNEANPYRKALTPIGARKCTISSQVHRVENIYLWGEKGDIVLLLHGWGANCSSMFGFVDRLLAEGYRVATFDGPAHGCTPGEYATMSEYVAATRHVIEHLQDVKYIVAHSLGGIVAMAAAAQSPGVEQLVFISSPSSLLDVLDIWSGNFMKLRSSIRERILKQLLADNGVPVSHWNIISHGKNWHKPIQIIHDKNDEVVGCDHANKLNKALHSSDVFFTEGLGHVKPLMNPLVHQKVVDFLRMPHNHHTRTSVL